MTSPHSAPSTVMLAPDLAFLRVLATENIAAVSILSNGTVVSVLRCKPLTV